MDSALGSGAVAAANSGRVLSSKQRAPPPPQIKRDPIDVDIQEDDIPRTLSSAHRKALLKQSKDQAKEVQAIGFRKLDGQEQDQGGATQAKHVKVSLAHSGEKLLATFYGMLYTNDGAEKEWKLEVDGFIPICFVQAQGNANKPFRIIAVEKSKRIIEYQVNVNTICARNQTFVKWQDGASMFGVRFTKEDQAEQFSGTVKRMASMLNKTAQLMKQPERKAMIRKMSDPDASNNLQYTKVSLMIKLPDKQSTIMSVPGLLTMSELFDMICEKENLNPSGHQLSLPRTGAGARKVTFDSGTAIGSLKIREVAIIRTTLGGSSSSSTEAEDNSVEDLLDVEGEQNKILQLFLPSGAKKSYRVPLDMTMKQLVMRVCSRESLNPRHHSLQYVDFKHEFLEAGSTVDEIGVNQVRLMDRRVLKRNSLTTIKTDDLPSPPNRKQRRSCGDELDSDSLETNEGDRENKLTWQQRSKSLDVLAESKPTKVLPQIDVHITKEDSHALHSVSNGSVPTERRNSSEATTIKKTVRSNSNEATATKKPPVPPQPYASKSTSQSHNQPGNLQNGGLRDQGLSPIKKNTTISASTPNLSTVSSRSDDSPEIKTSTPDTKRRRRAAPPPPPRPAAPKALFTDVKSDGQVNGTVKNTTNVPPMTSSNVSQAPELSANEIKLKPSQKKRPAPPRPSRPPPPQPAQKVPKQGSLESKNVDGVAQEKEIDIQVKQDKPDRAGLSLDLDLRTHSDSVEEYEFEEDGLRDLRGIPIFIPPPPPDELPPPLDECETPVGPLTDLETDILEGSASEEFPVTVNGYVGMPKIGMYAGHGASDSQAQVVPKPTQGSSLETALEQNNLPNGKDSFTVVPPPPLYSEPETSNLTDIPPPILETQTLQTSSEAEEKDHDSGFDQSPEHLIVTPPADPSRDVPVERWEDPDTGSDLDVISAIPPPADFETRPLTPPCQFANSTVAPPVGFISEDDKKDGEPKREIPRKKLNVTEGLFPWMNEPQAPVNAEIPVELPKGTEDESITVKQIKEQIPSASEDSTEAISQPTSTVVGPNESVATVVYTRPEEEPTRPELNVQQNIVSVNPDVSTKAEVTRVEVAPSVIELQRSLSNDQSKEPNVDTSVQNKKSKEEEQSGLQQVLGMNVKKIKPEITAKPVAFVKETEVSVEREVDVQQYTMQTFTPSAEAVRPEPQVVIKPEKPDLQVKPDKPEAKAKPVAVVHETEVQIESLPPCSFDEPSRPEARVEPATVEQQVKPVKPEVEVKVDIQQPTPLEVVLPQPQVEAEKQEQRVIPEKPELTFKPVARVQEQEVKVDASVNPPVHSSFNPSSEALIPVPQVEPAKPVLQVIPHEPEVIVNSVAFVKETEVKIDAQQAGSSSFNSTVRPELQPAKLEHQVQPEIPEKYKQDIPDGSFQRTYKNPSEEAAITVINVGKEDIVAEAPVTPETKLISTTDDKLKDIEARMQELDKEPVPPPSAVRKLETKTAPVAYMKEKPVAQPRDPFMEEVIVAESKQVEFSSYEQFGALLMLDMEEATTKEAVQPQHSQPQHKEPDMYQPQHKEPQESQPQYKELPDSQPQHKGPLHSQPKSSSSTAEAKSEFSLDLSSLRQSPEPPRPPSSSPPAISPRTSSLPSPGALDSARSTDSGFATLEKLKNTSLSDIKPSEQRSHNTPANRTETKYTDSYTIPTASEPVKPHTAEKPNVASKLLRPLSMPAGILRDVKRDAVKDENKPTESESRKIDAVPEKSRTDVPRASTSSESSGISSPSPASSPVTTEAVDMPKPPPLTVPPLRRYSDLAADLSFIASAAKAAEKANEAESKVEVPPKPQNVLLRRNPGTAAAAERPRSWVAPETEAKESRPRVWSSAFKPVKFDSQGKKGVRPVDFQVKAFNPPPTAPKPFGSSASSVNSTPLVQSAAPVAGMPAAKQPDISSQKEVVKPSYQAPPASVKPLGNTTGKSEIPAVSLLSRDEETSSHQPVKPVSTVERRLSNPLTKKTEPVAPPVKPSGITNVKSEVPVLSLLPRDEETSTHQPVKPVSTVERRLSNPLTKKTEPAETKYQIIFSDKTEKASPQGPSNVPSDKTDSGSHKVSTNPVVLRDQILRDQCRSQSKVARRPQSAFVSGTKFQIFGADEKTESNKEEDKKPATAPPKGAAWKHAIKQQPTTKTSVQSNKQEVPAPAQPSAKPQPPAAKPQPQEKPAAVAAAESKPPPAVVMRSKTEQQDPTKRHSLPTYIIEGADRKQPVKTISSKKGNFNFIVEEAQTDTTVVPQGVVAAMKALREKQRAAQGVKEGVLDLEHTQWI